MQKEANEKAKEMQEEIEKEKEQLQVQPVRYIITLNTANGWECLNGMYAMVQEYIIFQIFLHSGWGGVNKKVKNAKKNSAWNCKGREERILSVRYYSSIPFRIEGKSSEFL